MKKKIELVFENCESVRFNPEDVCVSFDIDCVCCLHGYKYTGIKNVSIAIRKNAKATMNFGGDWKERIKIADITHIYIDGEDYAIIEYEGDEINSYQTLEETKDSFFLIEIRRR